MTEVAQTPETVAAIWKRLSSLAARIEDEETRAQYLSTWRARFDAQFPPPAPAWSDVDEICLPNGSTLAKPTAAERAAVCHIARLWWREQWLELGGLDESRLKAVAYNAARRLAADLIEADLVEKTFPIPPEILTQPRWSDAWRAGLKRPFDVSGQILALRLARLPLTEFGLAERFNARFGHDFIYTTAKGWLGWDGKRWRVLDQDEAGNPAELIAAAMETIRAMRDEARFLRMTVLPESEDQGDKAVRSSAGRISQFAHDSETANRISTTIRISKRWLTRMIEEFDVEAGAINCQNGTLRVSKKDQGKAEVALDPHERRDMITRLAPVNYQPDAIAPLYDGLIKWAQPDRAMRRYLRQWAGYCLTGFTGAQILHFWHGGGANGKSTVIDAWAGAMGDYSGTIGIETFLDQGIKKRGDAATPDLARLGGVRLLRASEPERNAKINAALIKAVTGGEPMAVRALHKGFFDLRPSFKLTVSFNPKPKIPDTDEGIWRRIKLVEWSQFREVHERDERLPEKLKAESEGIFAWCVRGLVDWVENGFVEPEAVIAATQDYRNASDPLARFLDLCVVRAPGKRVQSSHLFEVYSAWCKATGETEWTPRGFKAGMHDKGFSDKTSNGVQWLDIELVRHKSDFVDEQGRVVTIDAGDRSFEREGAAVDFSKLSIPGADDDAGGLPPDW